MAGYKKACGGLADLLARFSVREGPLATAAAAAGALLRARPIAKISALFARRAIAGHGGSGFTEDPRRQADFRRLRHGLHRLRYGLLHVGLHVGLRLRLRLRLSLRLMLRLRLGLMVLLRRVLLILVVVAKTLLIAFVGTLIIIALAVIVLLTAIVVGTLLLLAAALALLFEPSVQHTIVVVGMLEIVFRQNPVARGRGVARHGQVFLHELLSIAPHPAVIATIEVGVTPPASSAATWWTRLAVITAALTVLHIVVCVH